MSVIPLHPHKPRGRFGLSGFTSDVLAEHFEVGSAARARRIRTEELDPVTLTCALAADPRGDGARIVEVVQEAFEGRFLTEAANGLRTLRSRLGHLMGIQIHEGHHGIVRVLLDDSAGSLQDRLRSQAALITEAAAIRHALGLEGM